MPTAPKPPAQAAATPAGAPSAQDATAIAEAGATAATQPGQTSEQAQAAATTAVRAEAAERNVTLSEEQVGQIANTMIAALEARGAFDPPPAPPANAGPADSAAPPEPAQAPPEAPRRKTFAERFVGRG